MEKLAITTKQEREVLDGILEREVLDGIFLLSNGYVDIPNRNIENHTHAYYTLTPSQLYDFEYVLVRTNDLQARLGDSRFNEWSFNFDELPLCQKFKVFVMLRLDAYNKHYETTSVIGIAPACKDEQNLLEFYDILSEYEKHTSVCKSAITRSIALAKFLHDNYVTEDDFKSGKQKKLPVHHFVTWGVPSEGYRHTNDLLSLFWR